MTDQELRTETEPIDPWVAINCNGGCSKPAEWQEAVFRGDERLPIKVGHCGDDVCKARADEKALGMAPYFTVQRYAEASHGRGSEGLI